MDIGKLENLQYQGKTEPTQEKKKKRSEVFQFSSDKYKIYAMSLQYCI